MGAGYDGITHAVINQPNEAIMNKQMTQCPSNWDNRVVASWNKPATPKTPPSAPTGLRMHQAKLLEAVVQGGVR